MNPQNIFHFYNTVNFYHPSTDKLYGEHRCYSSQRCSGRIIAGNKHLSKNILNADFAIYIVSKYLCVDMTICDSQKYFV
jgi:hypothetical protein